MNPRTTPTKAAIKALDKLRSHLKEKGIIGNKEPQQEKPVEEYKSIKEPKEGEIDPKDIPF